MMISNINLVINWNNVNEKYYNIYIIKQTWIGDLRPADCSNYILFNL